MAFFEPIVGGMIQGALGAVNNYYSAQREQDARYQNYLLNEKTAENADARTRALYNDFYSPSALMQQYKGAGLSPSLMFGGTPGQGGTAGAQGAGVNQPSTFQPISVIEGAQAALMAAQAENVKADTANKEMEHSILFAEKLIKQNEAEMKQWETWGYTEQYKIISSPLYKEDENGQKTKTDKTLYSLAENAKNYDQFINSLKEYRFDNEVDINSEKAQQTLREIYKISHSMQTELEILTVNKEILNKEKDIKEEDLKLLKWQNQLAEAMKNAGFAEMSAQAQIKFLEAQIAQADLTERQKKAWNRLIDRMGDSTMSDIAVIVLSIISNMSLSAGVNKSL